MGICTLSAEYDYETRAQNELRMACQGVGESWTAPPQGIVKSASFEVLFPDGRTWSRGSTHSLGAKLGRMVASKVTKVHVVFMNRQSIGNQYN